MPSYDNALFSCLFFRKTRTGVCPHVKRSAGYSTSSNLRQLWSIGVTDFEQFSQQTNNKIKRCCCGAMCNTDTLITIIASKNALHFLFLQL